jgi:hypothetical protein
MHDTAKGKARGLEGFGDLIDVLILVLEAALDIEIDLAGA